MFVARCFPGKARPYKKAGQPAISGGGEYRLPQGGGHACYASLRGYRAFVNPFTGPPWPDERVSASLRLP